MGGDTPPEVLLEGALQAAESLPAECSLHILAHPSLIEKTASKASHLQWHAAEESVRMDDPPLHAIKHRRGSSMHLGIRLLLEKEVDALVSTGSTGVLFGLSALKLKRLKGVIRPALMAQVPTAIGSMLVLDVGGSTDFRPEHLRQFAEMGARAKRLLGVETPRVGLLNIGSESEKGPLPLREAYLQLEAEQSFWKFVGNIEGKNVFRGEVDVLVTDGFTGNIFLKTAEGTCQSVLEALAKDVAPEALARVRKQYCDEEHSGALICGVSEVVVKCHGSATAYAFAQAIKSAASWRALNLPDHLSLS